MPDPRVRVIIDAVDNASKQIESISRTQLRQVRRFGLELTLLGGAMTAFGLKAISSGIEGANAVARLQMALDAVGDSSLGVQKAIDATLTTWSGMYGIKKTDLLNAFDDLYLKIGNAKVALQELEAAVIISRVNKIPLQTAVELLNQALSGEQGAIEKVREFTGVVINPQKSEAGLDKIIINLRQAAIDATPETDRLKASISNFFTALGGGKDSFNILDAVIGKLNDLLTWMTNFATNHPAVTSAIFNVFLAIGLLAVIGGTLLTVLTTIGIMVLALPAMLVAVGAAFNFLLGPIGLVTLAIFGLIAVGILVATFWEQIWGFLKDLVTGDAGWIGIAIMGILGPIGWVTVAFQQLYQHWQDIWNGMKRIAEAISNGILSAVETMVNGIITAINSAASVIAGFLKGAKAVLDAIPGPNPFGNMLSGAIGALNTGIEKISLPRVNISGPASDAVTKAYSDWFDSWFANGPEKASPANIPPPRHIPALSTAPSIITPGAPFKVGPPPEGSQIFNLNFNAPVYGMDDFNKQVADGVRALAGRGGFDNLFSQK